MADVLLLLERFSAIFFLIALALFILLFTETGKLADLVGLSEKGVPRFVGFFLSGVAGLLVFLLVWYIASVMGLRMLSLSLIIFLVALTFLLLSIREFKRAIDLLLYVSDELLVS